MPGNEPQVVKFLVAGIGTLELPLLGRVRTVGIPGKETGEILLLKSIDEVDSSMSHNAHKKADVYINGILGHLEDAKRIR
ncbi:hypothetical protein H8D30_06765 [bacterium]|nr:hypothetical protein [bacterium]